MNKDLIYIKNIKKSKKFNTFLITAKSAIQGKLGTLFCIYIYSEHGDFTSHITYTSVYFIAS